MDLTLITLISFSDLQNSGQVMEINSINSAIVKKGQ